MTTYLVAWCKKDPNGFLGFADIYETFIDLSRAKVRYEEIKALDTTHSANVCAVLESTDYF
tara:strand:- start:293 stop:475 length:183 start_codon:yes stop_codon:yes gene_type:complete